MGLQFGINMTNWIAGAIDEQPQITESSAPRWDLTQKRPPRYPRAIDVVPIEEDFGPKARESHHRRSWRFYSKDKKRVPRSYFNSVRFPSRPS
jgi:hypothetical protein